MSFVLYAGKFCHDCRNDSSWPLDGTFALNFPNFRRILIVSGNLSANSANIKLNEISMQFIARV